MDKPSRPPAAPGPVPRTALDRRRFLKTAGAQAGLLAASPSLLEEALAEPRAPGVGRQTPDVVIVGAGAWGLWTALYLLDMGASVTLVDQYGPGNSRATSGDETRGIRSAYGDREHWSRWASEAIRRWKRWDEEWSKPLRMRLFFPTGDVILRAEWDEFLEQTRQVWDRLGTRYERLTADEVKYRYPVIDVSGMTVALFETDAGVGRARRSCEAVFEVVRSKGGRFVLGHATLGEAAGSRLGEVQVRPGEPLSADAYVFACGPWLPKTLPEVMQGRMRVPLGAVCYFGVPDDDTRFTWPNLPSYNFPGVTGWPALPVDNRGFRVRTGGPGRDTDDPDLSDRWLVQESMERMRTFMEQRFPLLTGQPLLQTHSCHYDFSVSRDFIVDRYPGLDNVWIAGAGNAEGFKMGPVIGEYVARRVLGEPTDGELDEKFRWPEETYETRNGGEPQPGETMHG